MSVVDDETKHQKDALATALQRFNIVTYCVDNNHTCKANCRFYDPYGNGLYIVCIESFRVHACKRKVYGGIDECIPTNDGFNVVCAASGREIINQNVIDVDRNLRQLMGYHTSRLNIPLTQRQRHRAAQTKQFWYVLGDVISRVFQREKREKYNALVENVVRHYVEIVNRLFRDTSATNLRTKLTTILTRCTHNLHLGHIRISRLLRLEERCKSLLERVLPKIETSKKRDFIYRHPYESCAYVVRCTLDGFKKSDVVVLNADDFTDLAPMPTHRGLQNVFEIPMVEISACSLILQESFNKLH